MRTKMNRKTTHLIFTTFFMGLALFGSACSTKQEPIIDLADLAEEIQANGTYYSEDDWNSVTEELDAIERQMEQFKNDYSDEELKEIGRLKGILLAQYTKYSIKSIKNGVEGAMKEAEGLIDGFLNSFYSESSE